MDITLIYDGTLKIENGYLVYNVDEQKKKLPLYNISNLIIQANVIIDTKTLKALIRKKISVIYTDDNSLICSFTNEGLNSGINLINQGNAYVSSKRLTIAKELIKSSFIGMMRILKQHNISNISALFDSVAIINKIVDNVTSIEKLLLLEAKYRHKYYSYFNAIIGNKEFLFNGRNYKPCIDEVNAIISYMNGVLYRITLASIYKAKLNPSIAYLHSSNERPLSLAYDISEIYKPIVADRALFDLLNHKQLKKGNFIFENNKCKLTYEAKGIIIRKINEIINSTIKVDDNKYLSYKMLLDSDCVKLRRFINNEIDKLEFFKARW